MASCADWPIEVFLENVKAVKSKPKTSAKYCVLLTTGAMNPVHRGHVDMVVRAKASLENEYGYTVLAGWISPSHDTYVKPKSERTGSYFVRAIGRAQLVDISIADTPAAADWIRCGRWESSPQRKGWPDYPEVVTALQKHLQVVSTEADCADVPVDVLYVCGTDHARYCSRGFAKKGQGVIAVPRNTDRPIKVRLEQLVFCVHQKNPNVVSYSSTEARKALKKGLAKKAAAMLGERVLATIVERKYYSWPLEKTTLETEAPAATATHDTKAKAAPPLPIPKDTQPRTMFISATSLNSRWRLFQKKKEILDRALFFFGSKRSWMFHSLDNTPALTDFDKREWLKYDRFNPAFKAMILEKEKRGEVFFLKPESLAYKGFGTGGDPDSFPKASAWLQKCVNPLTGQPYKPLNLDPTWWRTSFDSREAKFCSHSGQIVQNFLVGEHDYGPTKELIEQSNPGAFVFA